MGATTPADRGGPTPIHLQDLPDGSWLAHLQQTHSAAARAAEPMLVRVVDYKDFRGLLRLTPSTDAEDLRELVDSELQMYPDHLLVYEGVDGVEVSVGPTGYTLPFPLELGQFWRAVDDLDQDLLHHAQVQNLPDWSEAEGAQAADHTETLADFFEVDAEDFVAQAGGDWRVEDGTAVCVGDPYHDRWYGSGRPLRVLLGIGRDEAIVAAPALLHADSSELDLAQRGLLRTVRLRLARTLQALGRAVRVVEQRGVQRQR